MSEASDNEAIEEINEEPLTKPKVKKPRSQAQIEAFEKVKERRKQNLEVKKQEKLLNSAKLLLESNSATLFPLPTPSGIGCGRGGVVGEPSSLQENKKSNRTSVVRDKVKYQKVPQVEPESECESESEEEVIVVKKKKPVKKPKKVRKIIIEESSSDEGSDEDYQPQRRYHSSNSACGREGGSNRSHVIRPNPNDIFC
jgi:hypothetical protein